MGTRGSAGTVSQLNQKIYKQLEQWRNWLIEGEHPYVYLDGLVLKRSWTADMRNVSVLVASASVVTVTARSWESPEAKEDKTGWRGFL